MFDLGPSSIQYYMYQTSIVYTIWYMWWNAFIAIPSIACYIEMDYDCNMSNSNLLTNSSSMEIANILNYFNVRHYFTSFYLFRFLEYAVFFIWSNLKQYISPNKNYPDWNSENEVLWDISLIKTEILSNIEHNVEKVISFFHVNLTFLLSRGCSIIDSSKLSNKRH